MYETLAVIEQTIRELRQPLDGEAIRTRMQEQVQTSVHGGQMLSLRTYLSAPVLVEPKLKGGSKREVIDELLQVLVRNGQLKSHAVDAARQAVWDREQSMSTGLQYGVAIPHGRTDAVDRLVCAVGVKASGVDFDALDNQSSTIFILTLSPKGRPAPHVQFMSTVSQVLNAEGRRRVLEAAGRYSAAEVWTVLTSPPSAAAPVPVAPAGRFHLAQYIKIGLLSPNLVGQTKEQIINELVGLLRAEELVADPTEAARAVLAREAQMSTGLGEGVAIPHGRTDAVGRMVCAVGIKPDGVEFEALDGKPSRIFVLVLTPRTGADPYLQFVAAVTNLLDADGRKRLLKCRTSQDMYAALTRGAAK